MDKLDIVKIENLKHPSDVYFIRWGLTKLCNYYCDFCIQGSKSTHLADSISESKNKRFEICDKLICFIENKLEGKYKKIKVFLIGGEPTIISDFTEILERLVDCKFSGHISFHITTNLSTKSDVLLKIKEIFSKKRLYSRKLSITASYYKQFTTEEEFVSKVKIFNNKKNPIMKIINKKKNIFPIRFNIGYPLINDSDYLEFLEFKNKYKNIAYSINYIIITGYKESISDKLKDKLMLDNAKKIRVTLKDNSILYFSKTNRINLAIDGTRHFNPCGFLCDSGIHNITIDNLGNVSRCVSCSEKSIIGNILVDDINLINDKFICPSLNCGCDSYSTILNKDFNKE